MPLWAEVTRLLLYIVEFLDGFRSMLVTAGIELTNWVHYGEAGRASIGDHC